MTTLDFLKIELQKISSKFPNITITYGYDSVAESHVVKIIPLTEYNNNSDLDEAWIPVSLKFMETFLGEEIAFISSDSILDIDDILLEYKANVCIDEEAMAEIYDPLTKEKIPPYSFAKQFIAGNLLESSKGYSLALPKTQIIEGSDSEPSYPYSYAA